MSGLFVTGTDTDCGKTQVGSLLAELAVAAGRVVRVCKPVETGCQPAGGVLVPADATALARAARDPRPIEQICPYRLRLPAAPDVAARAEGVAIERERLLRAVDEARRDADLTLVEGAGGIRVPIAPGLDMAGLARATGLPVLLVARAALGTINHTRLSLEAIAAESLPLAGVVVCHTRPALSKADRANLDRLLEELGGRLWGELPHGGRQLRPPLRVETLMAAAVPA